MVNSQWPNPAQSVLGTSNILGSGTSFTVTAADWVAVNKRLSEGSLWVTEDVMPKRKHTYDDGLDNWE